MSLASAPRSVGPSARTRVLIVDDSSIVRGLTTRWLQEHDDIEVVGVAINGEDGIKKAQNLAPDVIILDVEMPILDGLGALPGLLAAAPRARVLMASTLTQRNAEITLEALSKGAADFLPKPETGRIAGANGYQEELVSKVRALGRRGSGLAGSVAAAALARRPASDREAPASAGRFQCARPQALLIGASTGGPQALRLLFEALIAPVSAPVFVVQHMPPTFTRILAEHLGKIGKGNAYEARDGAPVRAGEIAVAPGGFHMTIKARAGVITTHLDQRPPVNYCRPAVDPLFISAAAALNGEALAVMLTGMGQDGLEGAKSLVKAGGDVVAQDEASSVVWGMPGVIARAGLAVAVEPIEKIATLVTQRFQGRAR